MTTYADLIDALTYRNYAYNRDLFPDIGPELWKLILNAYVVDAMEAKYQTERTEKAK